MNHLIWFLLYLLTYKQVRSYLLFRERLIFCGWANFSVKTYHNGHIHSNFFAHTKTHRDANRVLGYKTSKWSECTLTGSGGRFHKFSDHHNQSWGNTFPSQILSLAEGLGVWLWLCRVVLVVVLWNVKFSWKVVWCSRLCRRGIPETFHGNFSHLSRNWHYR